MKRIYTAVTIGVAAFTLSACGSLPGNIPFLGGDSETSKTSAASSSASSSAASSANAPQPTADDLNAVLAVATNPDASVEEKIRTVQGGEAAPELFETMTRSKQESGADFQVVPPVLPGYTPNSVLATVNFTLPDREPQVADNVEFIFEDNTWKLSQTWACTLITNTVPPEQVPPMCHGDVPAPVPPPADAPPPPAPAPGEPGAEVPPPPPAEPPAAPPAPAP
ncbi:hypothetical protein CFREI_09275 [Corynebacterium freiburgense]|nr:hypothetical protein CFREI_09275 [Corynebacterium freiburgense]